jgi:hypothetical protein
MRDLYAEIECPNCGHSIRIKVKEMVPGRSKRCPCCATAIEFSGDDGRKVQRALNDFERELKRLSRKITIKL